MRNETALLQTATLVSWGTNSSLECLCCADVHHGLSEQLTNCSTTQQAKKTESYRSSQLKLAVNAQGCAGSLHLVPCLLGQESRSPWLPSPLHRSVRRANSRAMCPHTLLSLTLQWSLSAFGWDEKRDTTEKRRKGFSSSNQAQPTPGNAVALKKAAGCQHMQPGHPWAAGLGRGRRVGGSTTTYVLCSLPCPLAFVFGHGLRQ